MWIRSVYPCVSESVYVFVWMDVCISDEQKYREAKAGPIIFGILTEIDDKLYYEI